MPPGGVGQPLLQSPVAGQQEQAFAVRVQAARGVDPGDIDVIGEAAPAAPLFRGELTEDAVGLVKEKGRQKPARCSAQEAWRAFQRFTTPIEIISSPMSIETGGRTMPAATTIVSGDPSDT